MTLNHLRISQRLALGFGLVILLILLVAAAGASCIGQLRGQIASMTRDAYPKTVLAHTISAQLEHTARSMRNLIFMTTLDEIGAEQAQIEAADRVTGASLAAFGRSADSAEGRRLVAAVAQARAAYQPLLAKFLKLITDGQVEQARDLALPEIAPVQQRYFDALERLLAFHGARMDSAAREAETLSAHTLQIMGALALAAAVLAVLIGLSTTRRISAPLRAAVDLARRVADGDLTGRIAVVSADETGQLLQALRDMNASLASTVGKVRAGTVTIEHAAHDIASGNADLAARTDAQAGALAQVTHTMARLIGQVRLNADNARVAEQMAGSASAVATSGGAAVRQVVATMGAIKDSSQKIADITGVIDGIAFQTNLLALNAAVEAARAGAHGRGFAVVASEVRSLAQRAGDAAGQIKLLIGDSVARVEAGALLVDAAGATMAEIVAAVQQVCGVVAQITAASAQQRSGIEELDTFIGQIGQMTQSNAALVDQAAAAAASLRLQAHQLDQAVAQFKLGRKESDLLTTQSKNIGNLSTICA